MRVGIGYDIHRVVKGRKMFLGGVDVPHTKGLLGYSDGDVVLHAVADAILGALALGDIGQHFPDNDPKYKGIASSELVKKVLTLAKGKGYAVNNVDTMIIAEDPKIAPHRDKMIGTIAALLEVNKESVSIKATTAEGVGGIGKGEAIAAYAVATMVSEKE